MLVARCIRCPYCDEAFESSIDTSAGPQEYIEDCRICCRPIVFRSSVDLTGSLTDVQVYRDDD